MPVYETITSRKNPLVTRMAKLGERKFRDLEGLFRLDGVKLFSEAVRSGVGIEYVFATKAKLNELSELIASSGARAFEVTDEVIEKLTDEKAPQGIVAAARKFPTLPEGELPQGGFRSLLLSSIRDPGNLGTIVRTAYAFGIDRIYLSRDCADIYSPKTIRAAMGTIFRQKLTLVGDENELVGRLKSAGCEVYAAALRQGAKSLGSFTLPERVCFAVGNEGHGLDDSLIDACSGTVIIPMVSGCESLNAAEAAGILAWEMSRAYFKETEHDTQIH